MLVVVSVAVAVAVAVCVSVKLRLNPAAVDVTLQCQCTAPTNVERSALTCQSSGLDRVRNDRRNVGSGEGGGYLQIRACGLRGRDFVLLVSTEN